MKIKFEHIFSVILLSLISVSTFGQNDTTIDKLFPNAFISKTNFDKIYPDVVNNPQTTYSQLQRHLNTILANAKNTVRRRIEPNPAVSITNDKPQRPQEGYSIGNEMNMIKDLCITYLFKQEKSYLDKAVEFLKAWAKVNVAVPNRNIHEDRYMPAVEGYSIIRRVISDADRAVIDAWITKRMNVFAKYPPRINNWGTCLLSQYLLCGYALENQEWVDYFYKTYPTWVKTNLYPNGTTEDLLSRDAFAYHAYNLSFYGKICHLISIYKGYEAADEFYARDVNWGASIKKSVDYWKDYIGNSEKYVHLEFVETGWAPDKTGHADYNKPYVPSSTMYALEYLYEFDKSIAPYAEKYAWKDLPYRMSDLRWNLLKN